MKKIIRILLGYIIVAITMLMIIPFMIVFLFLGKRRRKAFYTWALCFFIPLVNKVEQLVNS
nr:MAG TPA: chitin synthase regulator [Caudoviricetes sp.]